MTPTLTPARAAPLSGGQANASTPLLTDCLLVGHAKSAALVFAFEQWFALCLHMLQGNNFFLMPYRRNDGCVKYARSRPVSKRGPCVRKRIAWAWDTMCGCAKFAGSIGFYPTNENGQSRWAAFDVDAHDGDTERARRIAGKLFAITVEHPQLFVVLSTSGNGGWHLHLFTADFKARGEWSRLLRQIADMAGVEIKKGSVEIFPADTRGIGYAIRAPGTHNPKTDRCGEIAFESVSNAPFLCEAALLLGSSHKEITSLCTRLTTREENGGLPSSEVSPVFRGKNGQWRAQFAITAPQQRHEQLTRLVGTSFYQCRRAVAAENAKLQHCEANPTPVASLAGHLAEFNEAWNGMERQWLGTLTTRERIHFDELTDAQRAAFRVIRNWSRDPKNDSQDFGVSAASLARRLGLTTPGACKIRNRFCSLGVLRQTAPCVAGKKTARYAWLASEPAN